MVPWCPIEERTVGWIHGTGSSGGRRAQELPAADVFDYNSSEKEAKNELIHLWQTDSGLPDKSI
jgi:butyrate kinase